MSSYLVPALALIVGSLRERNAPIVGSSQTIDGFDYLHISWKDP